MPPAIVFLHRSRQADRFTLGQLPAQVVPAKVGQAILEMPPGPGEPIRAAPAGEAVAESGQVI